MHSCPWGQSLRFTSQSAPLNGLVARQWPVPPASPPTQTEVVVRANGAQSSSTVQVPKTHSLKPAPVAKQVPSTQSRSLSHLTPGSPGRHIAGEPFASDVCAQANAGGQCPFESQLGTQM